MSHPAAPTEAHESAWEMRYRDVARFAELVGALPEGPVTDYLRARLALSNGRLDETLRLLQHAEEALPDPTIWRARLLETRGNVLNDLGLDSNAQQSLTEAHQLYERLGDAQGLVSVKQNIATLAFQDVQTALELFREALAGAEQVGNDALRSLILLNIELAGRDLGMPYDERRAHVDEAYELVRTGWGVMAVTARCSQIDLALEAGDVALARRYAADLPDIAQEPSASNRGRIAKCLGALALDEGDPERAVAVARAAITAGLGVDDTVGVTSLLARALALGGRFEEAYQAKCESFEALDDLSATNARTSARALDVWYRTSLLRQEREREQSRADALEEALRDLRVATNRIRELSIRDGLTGLHNRQYLVDQGQAALRRASERTPAEVAVIDLDHFKQVNDTYGHAAGDLTLVAFARALRDHLPGSDIVARYGGEEFVVVRPPRPAGVRTASLGAALTALQPRLRALEVVTTEGRPLPAVTLCAGVTSVTRSDDLDAALGRADRLMYRAKRAGRNLVVCETDAQAGPGVEPRSR